MPLTAAVGYMELGLWEDALESLEELPAEDRMTPGPMMLRMRCYQKMGRWDLGSIYADILRCGDEEHRHAAGEFYHALAAAEMADGNMDFAKEAVRKAAKASPDVRLAMLDDPALAALW